MSVQEDADPIKPESLSDLEDDFLILELILRNYLPEKDIVDIRKAYFFARDAHKGQTRANGEPYISHPLAVAEILAEYQMDAKSIMAGLLHDVVEDTDYTFDFLAREFGEDVANLVQGVTKVGAIGIGYQSEEEVENLRRMLVATAKDLHVIVIKLADRLHNMRTLHFLPRHKQIRIAKNTLDIYAPLAHRLGLGRIKWELEDLCLMFLYPESYETIKNQVAQKRREREQFIREACQDLEKVLSGRGIQVMVEGRAKHFFSIFMKMRRDNKTFKEIHDLIALRVICENIGDCYAVLGEVHTMWRQVEGRFKDYISNPKPNNYRSIHTTVLGPKGRMMEIQIRTQAMHQIAEHGIAAHWHYKEQSGRRIGGGDSKWLHIFNQELPDTRDPEDFLQTIRNDMFSDEVYVYTPKGELIRLPKDATPVDFAYKIHTELGNKCNAAKVNGRIVSLNYNLKTGDVISILTSQNSHPSSAWLDFVKTSSARNKIRRFLLEDQRDNLVHRGQATLTREIQRAGLKPREFYNSDNSEEIAQSLGLKNLEDLFVNIGFGRINTKQVITRILQKNKPPEPDKIPKRKTKNDEEANETRSIVRLADIDDIMYRIARCCNPLPGDEIIGFVTRGRGVTIHKASCRNVLHFNGSPERILPLFWAGDQRHPVSVRLEIRANDRRNLLGDLSQLISSTGTDILGCNSETVHSLATFIFTLEVVNTNHLNTIIQQLYGINGVKTVKRLRPEQKNGSHRRSNHSST